MQVTLCEHRGRHAPAGSDGTARAEPGGAPGAGWAAATVKKNHKKCISSEPVAPRRPWSQARADLRGIPPLFRYSPCGKDGSEVTEIGNAAHALMVSATPAPLRRTGLGATGQPRAGPRAHHGDGPAERSTRTARQRSGAAQPPGRNSTRPVCAAPAQAPPHGDASLVAPDGELPHAACDFAACKGGCAVRGLSRRPAGVRAAPALVRRGRQGHAAVTRHPPHITAVACAQPAHSPSLPDQ
jgi:hypothetical protein